MTAPAIPAATGRHSVWIGPAVIAAVAWFWTTAALDPAGDYPRQPAGPGLTVDEIFNAEQGVRLVDRILAGDLKGFRRFDAELHDHPPLGRLWLGAWHEAALVWHAPEQEHAPVVVACARTGAAAAFGLLVLLIGVTAARWHGPAAGWTAAAALVLMPRVSGHAHLAALEMTTSLACAATVVAISTWTSRPSWRTVAWSGAVLAAALLTKIQAVLLLPPLVGWVLVQAWSDRPVAAAAPRLADQLRASWLTRLLAWGAIGGGLFLIGWPWLWDDPIGRVREYLATASDRATIYVWYMGAKWADRDVPWHFPWVHFAATVPVGLHALGLWGVCTALRNPAERARASLVLACLVFPLLVFSLPGLPVYDGERLYLTSFVLWALFIGRGGVALRDWLAARLSPRWSAALLAGLLAGQAWGVLTMAPAWLSYYNLLVGGASGAERLGLATTYWGDGVTRELLDAVARHVPPGSRVSVAPDLHPYQQPALLSQAPQLRARGIELVPWNPAVPTRHLLLFPRWEYLPDAWRPVPPGARPLAEIRRGGVVVGALYEFP